MVVKLAGVTGCAFLISSCREVRPQEGAKDQEMPPEVVRAFVKGEIEQLRGESAELDSELQELISLRGVTARKREKLAQEREEYEHAMKEVAVRRRELERIREIVRSELKPHQVHPIPIEDLATAINMLQNEHRRLETENAELRARLEHGAIED